MVAHGKQWVGLAVCCVLALATRVRAVTVTAAHGGATVTAAGYAATVDAAGCLPHLSVGGAELLNSTTDVARGFYLLQAGGRPDLGPATVDGATVSAGSDKAKVRYTFGDATVTVEATNLTGTPMSLFAVLDGRARAADDGHGHRVVTPTAGDWHAGTFCFADAKLTVDGLDRVWGPWGDGLQVLDVTIAPHATRTVTARPAAMSADDAKWAAALTAGRWRPGMPLGDEPLAVYSPTDWQVFQRRTATRGDIRVSGRAAGVKTVYVQIVGTDAGGMPLPTDGRSVAVTADCFDALIPVRAGGWYQVRVGGVGLAATAPATFVPGTTVIVSHVGVGEVFVIAGQSNSTNSGQFQTKPTSGLVSSYGGDYWQVADDPQIGPHDHSTGGSPWPAFGDAMAARYHVPIGIASTGHGGTSVKQWTPGDELFNWTEARVRQLGPGGFRAVLWHQGESDWGMSADEYARRLSLVIRSSQRDAGWAFPWVVARASYHNGKDTHDDAVRAGQAKLWADGVAVEGPDTDALGPDFRDRDGTGIHLSPKGLAAHGKAWADKVAAYLDPVLAAEPQPGQK